VSLHVEGNDQQSVDELTQKIYSPNLLRAPVGGGPICSSRQPLAKSTAATHLRLSCPLAPAPHPDFVEEESPIMQLPISPLLDTKPVHPDELAAMLRC